MRTLVLGLVTATVAFYAGTLVAQQPTPNAATDISAAEIDAVRKGAQGDEQMKVVDAGKYNVGVGILRRNQPASNAPQNAMVHHNITEVYFISDGSATMVTGGTAPSATPVAADNKIVRILTGPTSSGGVPAGGVSRKVARGDIVIIPPNIPHGFTSIDGSVEYIMVRIDPDRVLPAGYVNNLITGMQK